MARIIDAHIHFLLRDYEEINLLSGMDAAGVEKSLVLALPPLDFMNSCTAGNKMVYELCRRHPDRLAFGVYADPRVKDSKDVIRRYAELGAKAFKLYPPIGFFPDDAECMELYEVLAKLQIPIVSHTGATDGEYWRGASRSCLSSHWADPIRFDGLARQFPEIKWVLAHMGFPWSVNAWIVAQGSKNVYLDISGGGFWLSSLVHLYNSIGRTIPIDFARVIWGSDNCLDQTGHIKYSRGLLQDLGCDKDDFDGVFGENAADVFGL